MCFRVKIFISEINISYLKHLGRWVAGTGLGHRRLSVRLRTLKDLERNVGGAGHDRDMSRSQTAGAGAGINLALRPRFSAGAFLSGATIMPTCDE